jgi:hypothetical protein
MSGGTWLAGVFAGFGAAAVVAGAGAGGPSSQPASRTPAAQTTTQHVRLELIENLPRG